MKKKDAEKIKKWESQLSPAELFWRRIPKVEEVNYPDDVNPNDKRAPWNAPDEEEWVCESLAVCSWCSELKETNSEEMCEECFKSKTQEEDEGDRDE